MRSYYRGKSFVVTGSAQGQGAAEVLHLLQLGAFVYALDVSFKSAVDWCESHGVDNNLSKSLKIINFDVSDEQEWIELSKSLNATNTKISGLINNAGVTLRKTVTETSSIEWDRILSINVTAIFYAMHHLSPHIEDGGSIVNISSTAGMTGYFAAAYCTSKWAVRGLTKAAAIEFAARNIRVNTICPGLIETPMIHAANEVHSACTAKEFHAGNKDHTPLGRGGTPQEIAQVAAFLLGPDSSFITGADISVDGGMIGGGIYHNIGVRTGNLD